MTTSIGDLITQAEGFRATVYCDRCGNRLLKAHSQIGKWECSIDCIGGNLTVGYGQRVDGAGITDEQARAMLTCRTAVISRNLSKELWYRIQLDVRRAVLVDMAYTMGIDGLREFTAMLKSLATGEYARAAEQIERSLWAREAPARALRDAQIMRTGEMPVPQPKEDF